MNCNNFSQLVAMFEALEHSRRVGTRGPDVSDLEDRLGALMGEELVRSTGHGEHHCRWCGKRSWDGETNSLDRHDVDCPIFVFNQAEQTPHFFKGPRRPFRS